jgi:hypothetical protein
LPGWWRSERCRWPGRAARGAASCEVERELVGSCDRTELAGAIHRDSCSPCPCYSSTCASFVTAICQARRTRLRLQHGTCLQHQGPVAAREDTGRLPASQGCPWRPSLKRAYCCAVELDLRFFCRFGPFGPTHPNRRLRFLQFASLAHA